jgi:hypothetical protein
MPTGKKAMLEITKMKMTPALSAEHQRKWDQSQWECKLDDPERNYDPSREHLNFEIRKRGVIAPVDKTVCIKQKVDERIAEWKSERLAATGVEPKIRSTQHLSVCLVIGGNTELMNRLAFGDQDGEKNIISFICHCDEKGCHIHATITPILEDGRLCAKEMFGGGSLDAARKCMQEWHDWYAAVNEKWGLERGDDIHETGARHKSLEEHNRELHRENKSLEEELTTKRHAVKGLTTMIENLTRQQKKIEARIAELEEQLRQSDSNKADIARDIQELQNDLSAIKDKIIEKIKKLNEAKNELDSLRGSYDSQTELLNDAIEKDKLLTHYFNHHVSIMLKASILDQVLSDANDICLKVPDAVPFAEDTFIDDRYFLRWEDVLRTGIRVFIDGINGATSVVPSSGGGGTTNDMPW